MKNQKNIKKQQPNAHDKYKGAKDGVKIVLIDKNGKKTEIKR